MDKTTRTYAFLQYIAILSDKGRVQSTFRLLVIDCCNGDGVSDTAMPNEGRGRARALGGERYSGVLLSRRVVVMRWVHDGAYLERYSGTIRSDGGSVSACVSPV